MSILLNESTQPVENRQQLLDYFIGAEKGPEKWLIGVEHEKFPYRLSNLKWPSYEEPQGLRALMEGMQAHGWAAIMEGENIIGLTRGKAAITFEPGGQVELAGAPFHTLHENDAELKQHLLEANEVAAKLGIGFLGIGFHPTAKRDDISWVPKGRYKIMRAYMPKVGGHGLDMMLRTCTVQVNLDFASEADMVKKFRVSLAAQPIATALFASSPFAEGKANGYNSYRMQMWQDTDLARSGSPEFVYQDGFGYERYLDYALDVPMYFAFRDGKYIDCAGLSFRDFMDGKLPALPGDKPTMTDWANHLTTIFTDVRLKKVLEMRGEDVGMADMMQALPAFWVGLLYDDAALDAAWQVMKGWSAEDRRTLHDGVPKLGLKAQAGKQSALEIARLLLDISRQGLQRRARKDATGKDETRYLDPLFEIAAKGKNRADELLEKFGGNFDTAKLFAAVRL